MSPALASLSADLFRQHTLFDTHLPDTQLLISVIVPARNEAEHLGDTLDALRNQQKKDGTPIVWRTYEVLLLLNNCTDQSAVVAHQYQQQYPSFPLRIATIQLPPEKANVGTARRLLMDEACQRLTQVGRPDGIIASTDSDTVVDTYWIDQIVTEINNGCEVVGGRILTRPDDSPVRVNHLRDVTYRMLKAQLEAHLDPLSFDPWPRHFQHFGASLALTCAAYMRVGGMPNVPHLEDEALYNALVRTDARIRKSPFVRVTTSTRMQGRVEVGFSEQLRYWQAMNQANKSQLVEAPAATIQRFRNQNRLRTIWQSHIARAVSDQLQLIASELLIDSDWLSQQLGQTRYFGQLWEKVEMQMAAGEWATHWQPVPISLAIKKMRLFLYGK